MSLDVVTIGVNSIVVDLYAYDAGGVDEFDIYKDDAFVETISLGGSNSESYRYTYTLLTPDTTYKLEFIARDVANNTTNSSETNVKTLPFT